MTDPDESHQITECGLYLPDNVDEVTGLPWVSNDDPSLPRVLGKAWVLALDGAFVTCLPCAARTRRRRSRW